MNYQVNGWYKTMTGLPEHYCMILEIDGYDCKYIFPNGVIDEDETIFLSEIDLSDISLTAFGFELNEDFNDVKFDGKHVYIYHAYRLNDITIINQITDNPGHLYNSVWFAKVNDMYVKIDYINDIINLFNVKLSVKNC